MKGIVYKRVQKNGRSKSKLTLVSDNPVYHPYTMNTEDVLEMVAGSDECLSKANQQSRWDMGQLTNIVSDLQEQVISLRKKMN